MTYYSEKELEETRDTFRNTIEKGNASEIRKAFDDVREKIKICDLNTKSDVLYSNPWIKFIFNILQDIQLFRDTKTNINNQKEEKIDVIVSATYYEIISHAKSFDSVDGNNQGESKLYYKVIQKIHEGHFYIDSAIYLEYLKYSLGKRNFDQSLQCLVDKTKHEMYEHDNKTEAGRIYLDTIKTIDVYADKDDRELAFKSFYNKLYHLTRGDKKKGCLNDPDTYFGVGYRLTHLFDGDIKMADDCFEKYSKR